MDFTPLYMLILVFSLVAVVLAVFFVRKNSRQNRFSPLAGVSFAFIIAAIIFSEDGILLGYALMSVGLVLAGIDITMKLKK